MAEDGTFPPKKKDIHLDLACNYTSPAINVFAYRTHAHNYATLVSNKLVLKLRQTDMRTDRQKKN